MTEKLAELFDDTPPARPGRPVRPAPSHGGRDAEVPPLGPGASRGRRGGALLGAGALLRPAASQSASDFGAISVRSPASSTSSCASLRFAASGASSSWAGSSCPRPARPSGACPASRLRGRPAPDGHHRHRDVVRRHPGRDGGRCADGAERHRHGADAGADGQPLARLKRSISRASPWPTRRLRHVRAPARDHALRAASGTAFAARGEDAAAAAGPDAPACQTRGSRPSPWSRRGPMPAASSSSPRRRRAAEDERATLPGWFVTGPRGATFEVARLAASPSLDAAFLPDGDLLLLRAQLRLAGRRRQCAFAASPAKRCARERGSRARRSEGGHAQPDRQHGRPGGDRDAGRQRHPDAGVGRQFSFLQRTILLRFRLLG